MKTLLVCGLIALLGSLFNPWKEKVMSPEESRRRCDDENLKSASKLVERGVWWLSQPGCVSEFSDGSGAYLDFNINPSSVNDFYSRGVFSGLGHLLPSGPYSQLSLAERSKLEWKGSLEVKFEWAIGPHEDGKWVPVCSDLVVMRFRKPPS